MPEVILEGEEVIGEVGTPEGPTPALHPGGGVVMTKQSELADADINLIIERNLRTGMPLFGPGHVPRYGDFSGVESYHEHVNRLMAAEEDFASLPPAVRDLAQNDLGRFMELVQNPAMVEKMLELGLDASAIPGSSLSEEPGATESASGAGTVE